MGNGCKIEIGYLFRWKDGELIVVTGKLIFNNYHYLCYNADGIPLCGISTIFPQHSLADNLEKLISEGWIMKVHDEWKYGIYIHKQIDGTKVKLKKIVFKKP